MQGVGTLELIAELAVALLGFSGVVAVLGRRASGEWSAVDSQRFSGMITQSVTVLAMTLIPLPFYYAGFDSHELWGWASAICAVLSILVTLTSQASQGSFRPSILRPMWQDETVNRPALLYLVFVYWVAPAILLLNSFGLVFDRTFTPFLVAVLLHFAIPVILFVRLLGTSLLGGNRAA